MTLPKYFLLRQSTLALIQGCWFLSNSRKCFWNTIYALFSLSVYQDIRPPTPGQPRLESRGERGPNKDGGWFIFVFMVPSSMISNFASKLCIFSTKENMISERWKKMSKFIQPIGRGKKTWNCTGIYHRYWQWVMWQVYI